MKIILTGSLGNIGKPLTQQLVQKGHQVTVISSNVEKIQAIENLGAIAAIGSLDDESFLTETFTGADVVYTMVPPNYFAEIDIREYYRKTGIVYKQVCL
ncbi:SDR family oxidoreductase [Flavobacterium sp.]|uniref:SDR family oxidoreductase n=1 Tax=Flavobacterium sp. TaxID=239 RepID=UPI00374DB0E5